VPAIALAKAEKYTANINNPLMGKDIGFIGLLGILAMKAFLIPLHYLNLNLAQEAN